MTQPVECRACGAWSRPEQQREGLCSSCIEWAPVMAEIPRMLAERKRTEARERAERRAAWQKRERKRS